MIFNVEPERTIVYDAPFFSNQLELIRNITKSLPIDITLYVKEYYSMRFRSWREVQFYKNILNLPNVRLLHPYVNPETILEKRQMVITISSTAAMEAAFYEKPSIVFTDTVYSDLPSMYRIKNLEMLPVTIKKSTKHQSKSRRCCQICKFCRKNSFSFDKLVIVLEQLRKWVLDTAINYTLTGKRLISTSKIK